MCLSLSSGFAFPWEDFSTHIRTIIMPMFCLVLGGVAGVRNAAAEGSDWKTLGDIWDFESPGYGCENNQYVRLFQADGVYYRADVTLTEEQFFENVNRHGIAIMGQTADLAPADKKLYALRDVTGTVPSIPLIVSSIMSKKLASGSDVIVLDVKCGDGAFMKTLEGAEELADNLTRIGRLAGKKCAALITDMDQPLGWSVGNALEVKEALAVLRGEDPEGDLMLLCVSLGSLLLLEAGYADSYAEANAILREAVESGRALDKLAELVKAQGGDERAVYDPELLPRAPVTCEVPSTETGYVSRIHAEAVGLVSMGLGGGRAKKEDLIDPAVGVVLHKKLGDAVKEGESLATLHAASEESAAEAAEKLRLCYEFSAVPVERPPFIKKIL